MLAARHESAGPQRSRQKQSASFWDLLTGSDIAGHGDVGPYNMLGHIVEVLPWNGRALPVRLPFYNDNDMRLVLNIDSQF